MQTRKQQLKNLVKARKKWQGMTHSQRVKCRLYSNEVPKIYTNKIGFTDRGAIFKGGKEIFHLPIETAIYVPSTEGRFPNQKRVSAKIMKRRISNVRKFLTDRYGGFTSVSGIGGYSETKGKKKIVVQEPVAKVTAFSTKEDFRKHHNNLKKQIKNWRKKWQQQSIGYEYEGDLYYLK